MLLAAALLISLQTAPPPDSAHADAYLDATARELVERARARSHQVDRSITAYRVLARERISAGIRALRRDRTLYQREIAARILWRREGTGRVEVLGARQVVPVALPKPEVPNGAGGDAAELAFDPAGSLLLHRLGDEDDEDEVFRSPLAPGSEARYRFATGDTTRIRLSGGRVVRLVELRVQPRDPARVGLRGSMWLDLDSHAPVRAVFQLNRAVDFARDLEDDDDDIPGVLQPIEGDLRYLTIDYALWEGRWWLPRLVALEGEARAGGVLRLPLRFERAYEGYEVQGEGTGPVLAAAADSAEAAAARAAEVPDSTSEKRKKGLEVSVKVRRRCNGKMCWKYHTERAADSVLLHSELLPSSAYSVGEALISEGELRELAGVLGVRVPGRSPWHAPVLRASYLRPHLVRYNRVEGLALGARLDADLGPAEADLALWLGTADLQPKAELGVGREGFEAGQRLALYRRLETAEPVPGALGLGNSLSALLLGRDEGEYFRTLGVELTGRPLRPRTWSYGWRLFAERQTPAEKNTDLSVPHLIGGGDGFPANIAADRADQAGAELALGWTRGLDPLGFRSWARASALASTGTFDFVRPTLALGTGFPLPGRLVGALEAAAGTGIGAVPAQSLWYLGGPNTVRGYGIGSRASGPAFWRTRAEVASSFPAARLILFSDAGWAGEREALELDPQLLSAGVGVSFLDGLLRLDLARALRGHAGWRLHLHLDTPL